MAKEGWLRPSRKCCEATFAGRRRGSCEKIGIKRYSPPCITARRGGRAIQKISRSIRLSRGRGGFPMNPKGKPPRLRLLRWLRQIFFDDAATPPCGGALLCPTSFAGHGGIEDNWRESRSPLLAQGGVAAPIKKMPRSLLSGRRRGSCEKIGIKRYSPPCITARRGGRAIQKISRSIRLSRGRG